MRDIVFFQKADATVMHAAVYLADNVVYTKNGGSNLHPWMLSTIPELQDLYSFQLGPDEKLDIRKVFPQPELLKPRSADSFPARPAGRRSVMAFAAYT